VCGHKITFESTVIHFTDTLRVQSGKRVGIRQVLYLKWRYPVRFLGSLTLSIFCTPLIDYFSVFYVSYKKCVSLNIICVSLNVEVYL